MIAPKQRGDSTTAQEGENKKPEEDHITLMKETLWGTLPAIGLGFAALGGMILGVPYVVVLVMVVLFVLSYDVRLTLLGDLSRDPWRPIKNVVGLFVFIHAVTWADYYLGAWGSFGFILLGVLISAYILVRRWRAYITWIKYIERSFLYDGKTADERRKL